MPKGKRAARGGGLHFSLYSLHSANVVDGTRRVVGGAHVDADAEPGSGVIRNDLPLDSVPRIAVTRGVLHKLPLDHRAGFVLWLVDGKASIAEIFDACPMPAHEAAEILRSLAAIGVIALE